MKKFGDDEIFIKLNHDQLYDAINLINGAYAPLDGFMRENEFNGVVDKMRLSNQHIWTIPIILDVDKLKFDRLKNKKRVLLVDGFSNPVAMLEDIQVYLFDKYRYIKSVFLTSDSGHPGVADTFLMGDFLVGGRIIAYRDYTVRLNKHHLTPEDVKIIKAKHKLDNLVAFQTRNIPHRSHEYLQMDALKRYGALFINPVYGGKKADDFKDEVIIDCYQLLMKHIYPKRKVLFSILPLKMRYAGPKEALLHAVIRRNYGCTHFIVGRDHAGVKGFYRPFEAQEFLDSFTEKELGIKILKYPEVIACKKCRSLQFTDQCRHPDIKKLPVSGTRLREMIKNKKKPSRYLIRTMIYNYLIKHPSPFREK